MALFGYPVAQENGADGRRFWQASAQRRYLVQRQIAKSVRRRETQ
jgi:hypothetical protein